MEGSHIKKLQIACNKAKYFSKEHLLLLEDYDSRESD